MSQSNKRNESVFAFNQALGKLWYQYLGLEFLMRLAIDQKMGGASLEGKVFKDETGAWSLGHFSDVQRVYNRIFSDKVSQDIVDNRNNWAHGMALFNSEGQAVRYHLNGKYLDAEQWAQRDTERNKKKISNRRLISVNYSIDTLEKESKEIGVIILQVQKNTNIPIAPAI